MKKGFLVTIGIFILVVIFYLITSGNSDTSTQKETTKEEETTGNSKIPENYQGEYQEVSVRVDGSNYPGYFPNVTEVKKGKPVRLTFITENEQSCALAINVPDAGIKDKILPESGLTPIEFVPTKEGELLIYCGMNGMFNTFIKVVA